MKDLTSSLKRNVLQSSDPYGFIMNYRLLYHREIQTAYPGATLNNPEWVPSPPHIT